MNNKYRDKVSTGISKKETKKFTTKQDIKNLATKKDIIQLRKYIKKLLDKIVIEIE